MIGIGQGKISRAQVVERRFGVLAAAATRIAPWRELAARMAAEVAAECTPGRIVLISGASGSGKSLLMQALAAEMAMRAVVCGAGESGERLVVDCMPWLELEEALEVLARFGLGEVYTYLSSAEHLSTGQRGRLQLAIAYGRAMSGNGRVLLADEFATQLDRFSAAVIARNLRRVIDGEGRISAVVATCHGDLEKALRPDVVVECDFGEYRLGRRDGGGTGR